MADSQVQRKHSDELRKTRRWFGSTKRLVNNPASPTSQSSGGSGGGGGSKSTSKRSSSFRKRVPDFFEVTDDTRHSVFQRNGGGVGATGLSSPKSAASPSPSSRTTSSSSRGPMAMSGKSTGGSLRRGIMASSTPTHDTKYSGANGTTAAGCGGGANGRSDGTKGAKGGGAIGIVLDVDDSGVGSIDSDVNANVAAPPSSPMAELADKENAKPKPVRLVSPPMSASSPRAKLSASTPKASASISSPKSTSIKGAFVEGQPVLVLRSNGFWEKGWAVREVKSHEIRVVDKRNTKSFDHHDVAQYVVLDTAENRRTKLAPVPSVSSLPPAPAPPTAAATTLNTSPAATSLAAMPTSSGGGNAPASLSSSVSLSLVGVEHESKHDFGGPPSLSSESFLAGKHTHGASYHSASSNSPRGSNGAFEPGHHAHNSGSSFSPRHSYGAHGHGMPPSIRGGLPTHHPNSSSNSSHTPNSNSTSFSSTSSASSGRSAPKSPPIIVGGSATKYSHSHSHAHRKKFPSTPPSKKYSPVSSPGPRGSGFPSTPPNGRKFGGGATPRGSLRKRPLLLSDIQAERSQRDLFEKRQSGSMQSGSMAPPPSPRGAHHSRGSLRK